MGHVARVFQSGNSQAVRLPKELRLSLDRVEITREEDALIIRPYLENREKWASLKLALARGTIDDFLVEGRDQEGQHRPELDEVFP